MNLVSRDLRLSTRIAVFRFSFFDFLCYVFLFCLLLFEAYCSLLTYYFSFDLIYSVELPTNGYSVFHFILFVVVVCLRLPVLFASSSSSYYINTYRFGRMHTLYSIFGVFCTRSTFNEISHYMELIRLKLNRNA